MPFIIPPPIKPFHNASSHNTPSRNTPSYHTQPNNVSLLTNTLSTNALPLITHPIDLCIPSIPCFNTAYQLKIPFHNTPYQLIYRY